MRTPFQKLLKKAEWAAPSWKWRTSRVAHLHAQSNLDGNLHAHDALWPLLSLYVLAVSHSYELKPNLYPLCSDYAHFNIMPEWSLLCQKNMLLILLRPSELSACNNIPFLLPWGHYTLAWCGRSVCGGHQCLSPSALPLWCRPVGPPWWPHWPSCSCSTWPGSLKADQLSTNPSLPCPHCGW